MAGVEFGIALPSGIRDKSRRGEYLPGIERVLGVAKGHYRSAWLVDHLQFEDNDHLEGWTEVAYLSALHPEFEWGHEVICQSFRNPALLAKMGATLQFLSGGRFTLGIGAGWHDEEYRAYGYNFPPAAVRVEELDEALQIMRAMWTEEKATFNGKHHRVEGAYCEPKPDPVPAIMVGAFKPKMLRVAARRADWWSVSWTGIDEYREIVAECERACKEIGRDPATLRRTWFGGCACAPTEDEAKELAAGRFTTETAFLGTPAQIIDQLRPFVELGVDYFMLGCAGFPKATTVEMLVNEVIPAFKE